MSEVTPYLVLGAQFSYGPKKTYFYRAPAGWAVEEGSRIVVKNKDSFSIPTVVGVYPACGLEDSMATDWAVQLIDTAEYRRMVEENGVPA